MAKVDKLSLFLVSKKPCHSHAKGDCRRREHRESPAVSGNGKKYQSRLSKQHDHHVSDRPAAFLVLFAVAPFDQILNPDVDENKCPGHMILGVKALPVQARPLADIVQKVHVDEQKNVISHAVPPEHVDVISREIPDLNDRERTQNVRQKQRRRDKSALRNMQKRIVAAYDINEDQVVDQFQIFNFFLFFENGVRGLYGIDQVICSLSAVFISIPY